MDHLAIRHRDLLYDIWMQTGAAIREGCRNARHLQWRGHQKALADRELRRITVVPLFATSCPFPIRIGKQSRVFPANIVSGGLAEAELGGDLGDGVDARFHPFLVEPYIARLGDGPVRVDGSMTVFIPAPERAAVVADLQGTCAVLRAFWCDRTGLQPGE